MPAEQPDEALTPKELRRQEKREYDRNYYYKNKEKIRERVRKYSQDNKEKYREYMKKYRKEKKEKLREYQGKYRRERYHSDPEYRKKLNELQRKKQLRYKEECKRFKIEFGGKCSVCGNNDLGVLTVHHPDGREEGDRGLPFWQTKEFRKWLKHGIKPNVILLCANHHLELHKQST